MESKAVRTWLKKKVIGEAAGNLFLALLALMAGVVVLAVTFLLTYAVVWFGFNAGVSGLSQLLFNQPLRLSHPLLLLVCSAFLVLLFTGNARTDREYPGSFPKRNYPHLTPQPGVLGALGSLLADADVSSRMVADLLFSGPRLVAAAWDAFTKACRLMRLDVEGCSQLLAALRSRDSHISYDELSQLSEVSDAGRVFPQMRDIRGVVFIDSAPAGLSLTSELRGELLAMAGTSFPQHEAAGNPATDGTIYELLGVPPNASLGEIEAAYEKWIWRSRHERPGRQGQDWQEQTTRQIRAVNAAYEAFLRARKPKETEEPASRIETVWQQFKRSER